jgi:hypothetical protein
MNTKIKVIAVSIVVLLLAILLVSTVLAEGLTPTSTPVPQTPFGRWGGMMGGWGPRGVMGGGPTTGRVSPARCPMATAPVAVPCTAVEAGAILAPAPLSLWTRLSRLPASTWRPTATRI